MFWFGFFQLPLVYEKGVLGSRGPHIKSVGERRRSFTWIGCNYSQSNVLCVYINVFYSNISFHLKLFYVLFLLLFLLFSTLWSFKILVSLRPRSWYNIMYCAVQKLGISKNVLPSFICHSKSKSDYFPVSIFILLLDLQLQF